MGGVIFVFLPFFFNVFLSCSLEVPKLFSKAFPKAPQFYPIWFTQRQDRYWRIHLFLFSNWGSKEVLPLGTTLCSKIIADGPMKVALSKKERKSYKCTHELINKYESHYPPSTVCATAISPVQN